MTRKERACGGDIILTGKLSLNLPYFFPYHKCNLSVNLTSCMCVAEYSETLGLGLDQFYGLGLGLENETQKISVLDLVSILRL